MIKSWQQFNESSVYFEGSTEFLKVRKKYALKKEDILDFLQDLEDERDISYSSFQSRLSKFDNEQIVIKTWINFSKSYKNPKFELNDYQSFLKEQIKDIDQILITCERIAQVEELQIIQKKVESPPFQGAGANQNDLGELRIAIVFQKTIQTDEMERAHKEFIKKDNPEKEAYQSVIRKLVEMGIPGKDVEKLIDLHPDWENMDYIIFGFMTNDEILSIATYDKIKKKLFFERVELNKALDAYKTGECNEYLE
jgi:vacuolar-type H+-ATPase subunit I/STV1